MLHLTTAVLLRIASVVVFLSTLAAAVGGWVGLGIVESALALAPELGRAAEPSENVVDAVDETLEEVGSGLRTLGSITDQVASSTDEAADVVEEIADLSSGRIPDALSSLEAALPALIDTAAVIDDTMRTLSILGIDYRPQVPLDEAFSDVQTQLDDLPETLRLQGENLDTLGGEMRSTGAETSLLTDQIHGIEESLAETQLTLDEYAVALEGLGQLAEHTDRIHAALPLGRAALAVLAASGLILGLVGWALSNRLRA